MAQYTNDFSQYTVGTFPSDFHDGFPDAHHTWAIEPIDGVQALYCVADNSSESLYTAEWSAINTDTHRDNVEILAKFKTVNVRSAGYFSPSWVLGRYTIPGSNSQWYAGEFYISSSAGNPTRLDIPIFVSPTETFNAPVDPGFVMASNTYYWMRFRINGTTIQNKIWQDGSAEPGSYNTSFTSSAISGAGSTVMGLSGSLQGTTEVYYTFFSVGTNGDPAPFQTVKTQTGKSRIQLITSKTQTGKARITATTLKTQTGKSRIQISTTKTQTGVAKISTAPQRNQTGVARITATTSKTQTGNARIQIATLKTQTGVSRVIIKTSKTQAGVSRITAATLKTQTGKGNIRATTIRTQVGKASMASLTSRLQQGKTSIASTQVRIQTGVARIIFGRDIQTQPDSNVSYEKPTFFSVVTNL